MMMRCCSKKHGQNKASCECGQSVVEFALVSVILVTLLVVPLDFYRLIGTKMSLDSATSEAAAQVSADNLSSTTALLAAQNAYGDSLDDLAIAQFAVSASTDKQEYDYKVFSSDLSSESVFSERFESRPSNYHYRQVNIQLSCTWEPVTFLGSTFLGAGGRTVYGDELTRDVYVSGYVK